MSLPTMACNPDSNVISTKVHKHELTQSFNKDSLSPDKTIANSMYNKSIMSEEVIVLKGELSEILTVPDIRRNFITLMLTLSLATFSFFCMNFQMKNVEGNMFDNMMASQLSEVAADCVSGLIFYCVGAKRSFCLSFLVGLIGHILLVQAIQAGDHLHVPVFISVAKFGISSAFNICYIASM